MQQMTIRGFDGELLDRLKREAHEKGVSLNKAALQLLRRATGLDQTARRPELVGDSLDRLIGAWSEQEEREFLESIEPCEHADESLWR